MGARSYIIPIGSMTQSDQKNYRLKAVAAAVTKAFDKKVGDPADIPGFVAGAKPEVNVLTVANYLAQPNAEFPKSLALRESQPILDFGCALDQWNSAALAAVGTAYSNLQAIAAPAINAVRVHVFYGVSIDTIPLPISRMIFRDGGVAGNIRAFYDIEQLVARQEMAGFFSEPVVWEPNLTYAMQVLCRIATGVLGRFIPMNFTIEPAGQQQA